MGNDINHIFIDCDPTVAEDRSLPTNAFLVEYLQDGVTKFDLVTSLKKVDIFDHYWDNYRSDLQNITQSQGNVKPNLWINPATKQEKEKEKK